MVLSAVFVNDLKDALSENPRIVCRDDPYLECTARAAAKRVAVYERADDGIRESIRNREAPVTEPQLA